MWGRRCVADADTWDPVNNRVNFSVMWGRGRLKYNFCPALVKKINSDNFTVCLSDCHDGMVQTKSVNNRLTDFDK